MKTKKITTYFCSTCKQDAPVKSRWWHNRSKKHKSNWEARPATDNSSSTIFNEPEILEMRPIVLVILHDDKYEGWMMTDGKYHQINLLVAKEY